MQFRKAMSGPRSWPLILLSTFRPQDGPYAEKHTLATQEEEYWQNVRKDQARRAARGSARKDPKPGRVRPKNWTTTYIADPDGYDDLDIADRERVVPRGETEARQAKTPASPLHPGLGLKMVTSEAPDPESAAVGAGAAARDSISRGTVVEVSSGLCRVALPNRTLLCNLRSSLRIAHSSFSNVLAAGDEVVVSHNGHERGMVEAVLPRRSALARPDVFYAHLQQVIVANVDQVLIVAAWREPAFWPELVDRYLIAAARYNLAPIICVNKVDLAEDPAELAPTLGAYQQTGYRILATSARTGEGLAALREALAGRTTALAGLSGVGKSSLLSAAEPGLHLRTAEVSDRRHEGRHTTTQVTLHPLAAGGFVADTPGIREFGLSGLKGRDLPPFYPEIAGAAEGCTYADCSHMQELGCAVTAAVQTGRITAMRYDSYRKIRHSLPE